MADEATAEALKAQLDATQWDQLVQRMQQMPPEEREAYFTQFAADNGIKGSDASDDMSRADMMRVDPMSIGTVGGRHKTAAHPLAHLGAAAMNYQAGKQFKDAKQERGDARAAATDQRTEMMRGMVPPGGQPPQQQAPPPQQGPRPPSMGGPGRGAAGGMKNPGGMNLQQMLAAMRSR